MRQINWNLWRRGVCRQGVSMWQKKWEGGGFFAGIKEQLEWITELTHVELDASLKFFYQFIPILLLYQV